MRENLQCNCHICNIERQLVISLSEPACAAAFLRIAHVAAPLAGFSTSLALVEHLHANRDGEKSVPSASEVVGSLMRSSSLVSETELRNSVLVLSFVPMIHRTYREVRAWFREIEAEDIAHAGKSVTDDYSKLKDDLEFRKEVAIRVGLGFELPAQQNAIGPNGPKTETEPLQEMAATA